MTLARPNTDWSGLLDPGETLLWQGRPDAGLAFGLGHLLRILRSLVMLRLFLYLLARLQTSIASYWDVRLIVLFVFFLPVPLDLVASMIRRSQQSYALTTSRALIRTRLGPFGQSLRSYPMTPDMPLTLLQGPRHASLLFAPAPKWYSGLITTPAAPGFERIGDATSVYALMRQVQKDTR